MHNNLGQTRSNRSEFTLATHSGPFTTAPDLVGSCSVPETATTTSLSPSGAADAIATPLVTARMLAVTFMEGYMTMVRRIRTGTSGRTGVPKGLQGVRRGEEAASERSPEAGSPFTMKPVKPFFLGARLKAAFRSGFQISASGVQHNLVTQHATSTLGDLLILTKCSNGIAAIKIRLLKLSQRLNPENGHTANPHTNLAPQARSPSQTSFEISRTVSVEIPHRHYDLPESDPEEARFLVFGVFGLGVDCSWGLLLWT